MNDLISIIIPVYNVEEYLEQCIQSIVCQTYRNLEIILVDDGSTDKSAQICDKWAKKDDRIRVIHKPNSGVSAARNAGLAIAKGDYIGFVDSDDYISPEMYEKLLSALKKSPKKISYCKFQRVKTDSINKVNVKSAPSETYDLYQAINGVFYQKIDLSVWSKLFDKIVFEGIRFPEGETNEEAAIMIPMLIVSDGIEFVNEVLYFYRECPSSITATYWKTDADMIYKNFSRVYNQLCEIKMQDCKSFKVYLGKTAFSIALHLDKNYYRINDAAKENLLKYIKIMKKLFAEIIFSNHMALKHKILYIMVITRTLRPIYKILGKN